MWFYGLLYVYKYCVLVVHCTELVVFCCCLKVITDIKLRQGIILICISKTIAKYMYTMSVIHKMSQCYSRILQAIKQTKAILHVHTLNMISQFIIITVLLHLITTLFIELLLIISKSTTWILIT